MSLATVYPRSPEKYDFVEPKFSSGRHRPHTRLNDWHSTDYDEEVFTELSYYNRTFANTSVLTVAKDILLDFNTLKNRNCSTSTPFVTRTVVNYKEDHDLGIPLCQTIVSENDLSLNETEIVSDTFANSCKIASQCHHEKGLQSELASDCNNCFAPLPCVSLEFESSSSDEESQINITTENKNSSEKCNFIKGENLSPSHEDYHILKSLSSSNLETSDQYSLDSGYNSQILSCLESTNSGSYFHNSLPVQNSANIIKINTEKTNLVNNFVSKFSPKPTEVLIGPKIGVEKVDIITNLYEKNIFPALDIIFSLLTGDDLINVSEVHQNWKSTLLSDSKAKQRYNKFLQSNNPLTNKENDSKSTRKTQQRGLTGLKEGPFCLLQLKAAPEKSPSKLKPHGPPLTRHQLFVKAASALKNDESLRKCPMCNSPAKTDIVQERACCTYERCAYDFCIKCRNCFHGANECTASLCKKTKTESSVGTKKSKKNLKRL